MSLAQALREAALPTTVLAPPRLVIVARQLASRWSQTATPPQGPDLDAVVERFAAALGDGASAWRQLGPRDWRSLPWALWHQDSRLAREPALLDALEARLRQTRRRSLVAGLIGAYLHAFSPGRPGLDRVAALLAEQVERWDWPWRERAWSLHLFTIDDAPARLAEHCLAAPAGARAALREAGLAGVGCKGLPLQALLAALERLKLDFGTGRPTPLEPVIAWCSDDEGQILAPARGPLAEALLLPWAQRPPPDALRAKIEPLLLRHYGDPRVRPKPWLQVSDAAQAVFRRWLVKVALDQFLEVIDRTVIEYRHQWRYRRAFWSAWYRSGEIHEAHVMFAPVGYRKAKRLFGKDAPCAELTTGTKPVAGDHAVLLLRIGRLVIADWSHNGRCAIWDERVAGAPRLNRLSYTSTDVDADAADWNVRHAGAETYSWQRKVRDHIALRTGVHLPDRAFQVP
jgi:hypothetical protein